MTGPDGNARAACHADAADTLYFDGQCSLCAGEIEQLRQHRGNSLKLVDIHSLEETRPGSARPSRDTLLRRLYLQRADGTWLSGADANVAAWEGTRHGRLLAALRLPLLRYPVDVVYALWARWRYRRLYGHGSAFMRGTGAPVKENRALSPNPAPQTAPKNPDTNAKDSCG